MTKGEYINNLQKKADKVTAAFSPKGLMRKRIVAAFLCIGTIATCFIGSKQTNAEREGNYNSFVEGNTPINLENLDYKDTFSIWNDSETGNDVNTTLSGGELYSRNGIKVFPEESSYAIQKDSDQVGRIDAMISYVNVWGDTVIYRNNKTRNICSFDLNTKESKTLVAKNVGEIFVTGGQIFFTDFDDERHLFVAGMDGRNPVLLIDSPVNQFVVIGDTVLYLGYDSILRSLARSTGTIEILGKGVERFFVDGGLVIESSNSIYRTKPDGTIPTKLYDASEDGMNLIGAKDGVLYYQESGKLYAIIGGSSAELISNKYSYYGSLVVEDNVLAVIAYTDTSSAAVSQTAVEIALDIQGAENGTE